MGISSLTSQKPVSRRLAKKARDIVDHVIATAIPNRVYMVGSLSRGIGHEYSDLDLVVVVSEPFSRQEIALKVLPSRPHWDVPVDLHVVGHTEFDQYKEQGGICFEAYRHGQLIYTRGRHEP